MGSIGGLFTHFFIVGPILKWLLSPKRPWRKEFGVFLIASVVLGVAVYQYKLSRKLNHYDLLNVDESATKQQIQTAFRRMSLTVHPDRNPHPSAAAQFDSIRLANEVLGNPERRNNYHRFGDFNNKGLVGDQDIAYIILLGLMRLILPGILGIIYLRGQSIGRTVHLGYLGITLALELLFRFQPVNSYHSSFFKLPLLVFERIEFLQVLIPALLNAIIIISPHFGTSAFVAHSDHQDSVAWTVYPASLTKQEILDLVYAVGEQSFGIHLQILERLKDSAVVEHKNESEEASHARDETNIDEVLSKFLTSKNCIGVDHLINRDILLTPLTNEGTLEYYNLIVANTISYIKKKNAPSPWYSLFATPSTIFFIVMLLSQFIKT